MSHTLTVVQALVAMGNARVSQHGLTELADDYIMVSAAISGVASAVVVEDYPDYAKGPCVLCLQLDQTGNAIHILWGLALHNPGVATIITGYRPDSSRWMGDNMTRRPK